MFYITALTMIIFLATPAVSWGGTCTDTVNGSLEIGTNTGVELGRFTSPVTGSATVVIDASTGTRALPSELNINDSNQMSFGDAFTPAEVFILGGVGCYFRITVLPVLHAIVSVTVAGTELISAQGGGFLVSLGVDGQAIVKIGASVSIGATTSTANITNNNAFEIVVTYVDAP